MKKLLIILILSVPILAETLRINLIQIDTKYAFSCVDGSVILDYQKLKELDEINKELKYLISIIESHKLDKKVFLKIDKMIKANIVKKQNGFFYPCVNE